MDLMLLLFGTPRLSDDSTFGKVSRDEEELFGPIRLSGRSLYDDGQMINSNVINHVTKEFLAAPMVAKKMGHNENPVVIVVSPLVALMEEQVKEATEMGVTAMQLGVHDEVDFTSGRCQLLFGNPESWLLNKKWRDMLGSDVFEANVIGIVVDEVHLTYKW
ncbi:unnamed protein product [Pleuronectes platessa]|uniref:DEAD/DEAH-box helicase domain-containing protein n=1 Tax=Pleuronectes platessa TaxID=8262 RepID=A0A9N7UUU1_PLEPL|nr:unnamed protein product [Pleuronectes platessa]